MEQGRIRTAVLGDAEAILGIYAPYIQNTAITFEYEIPSREDFIIRMRRVMEHYPWLVYEECGEILGYAYCGRFRERAAFDWACEISVYVDERFHRKGIATRLYNEMFMIMNELGYGRVYASIVYPNDSSIALHKKLGFQEVGIFHKTGYKLGRWWDLMVMEKFLELTQDPPARPKAFHEQNNDSRCHIVGN